MKLNTYCYLTIQHSKLNSSIKCGSKAVSFTNRTFRKLKLGSLPQTSQSKLCRHLRVSQNKPTSKTLFQKFSFSVTKHTHFKKHKEWQLPVFQKFSSAALKAMDLVMRSNSPDFMMGGANVIEKIGHALHMQEMWAESAEIFRDLNKKKNQVIVLLF